MGMSGWLVGDAAQVLLQVMALFVGGYGGARAAAVARMRIEVRQRLWRALPDADRLLATLVEKVTAARAKLAPMILRTMDGRDDFVDGGDKPSAEADAATQELNGHYSTLTQELEELRLDVDLLPWSERESFAIYEEARVGSVIRETRPFIHLNLDLRVWGHSTEYSEYVTRNVLERLVHQSQVRTVTVHRGKSPVEEARDEFRDHLHRRLRPGWWRRPKDLWHTAMVIVNRAPPRLSAPRAFARPGRRPAS